MLNYINDDDDDDDVMLAGAPIRREWRAEIHVCQ